MSVKTISRLIGAFLAISVVVLLYFFDNSAFPHPALWWAIGIGAGATILALIFSPYLSVVPYRWMRESSVSDLLAAVVGLVIGLIIAILPFVFLSTLPSYLGHILSLAAVIIFSFLGVTLAIQRKNEFAHLFQGVFVRRGRERDRDEERSKEREKPLLSGPPQIQPVTQILLDTSAIIDGRIADISQTGFIAGALIVPRFVLAELQRIADSADTMRRNRGRRGLEMLNRLQKDATVPIEITDADVEGIVEVDSKLVKLARTLHCPIITNDFNLNRVAELQGVKVLNINELANAVKPVLLPGEDLYIKIMQDGKELGQGVGYLDDGTMIVVEGGRQYMNTTIEVNVTRVLQTVAGRMIFAHPKQQSPTNNNSPTVQTPTSPSQSANRQKPY